MLNIDAYPSLYWQKSVTDDTSSKNLSNIMRQNDKILTDAQDRTYEYTAKKNRIGYGFESLFRSIGLAGGVLIGGPVGAATMSSIGGGIGRGLGEHFGNKIYGKTLYQLNKVSEDYKYRQMSNSYALKMNEGSMNMIDELYDQSMQVETQIAKDLGES